MQAPPMTAGPLSATAPLPALGGLSASPITRSYGGSSQSRPVRILEVGALRKSGHVRPALCGIRAGFAGADGFQG